MIGTLVVKRLRLRKPIQKKYFEVIYYAKVNKNSLEEWVGQIIVIDRVQRWRLQNKMR